MEITLTPETEGLLNEMARYHGVEANALAESCVKAMLRWQESEPEAAKEAMNRAKQASEAQCAAPDA